MTFHYRVLSLFSRIVILTLGLERNSLKKFGKPNIDAALASGDAKASLSKHCVFLRRRWGLR